MDLTKVELVLSAKGNDMLCVDNFLYYYDDRNVDSYCWVCTRRQDKTLRCRARVVTTVNNEKDKLHTVKTVFGQHTHERCSNEELLKFQYRMSSRISGRSPKLANTEAIIAQSNAKTKYFKLPEREQKLLKKCYEAQMANKPKTKKDNTLKARSDNFNDYNLEKNKLYMLQTLSGRQMLCLNGFIYRQDGKSRIRSTYRWMCIRHHDVGCNKRIYTECMANECHRLKSQLSKELHIHDSYSTHKLTQLLNKNNISSILEHEQDDNDDGDDDSDDQEGDVSIIGEPSKDTPIAYDGVAFVKEDKDDDEDDDDDSSSGIVMPLEPPRTRSSKIVAIPLCEDPLGVLEKNGFQDPTKFYFLPSSKGKQVLVFDNYTFHFNFKSQGNEHSYWTCTARRKIPAKCRVHLITTMSENGPTIVNVSGKHTHPHCLQDLKRRIERSLKLKADEKQPAKMISPRKRNAQTQESLAKSLEVARKKIKQDIAKECKKLQLPSLDGRADDDARSDVSSSSSILSSLDSVGDHLDVYEDLPNEPHELKKSIEPEVVFFEGEEFRNAVEMEYSNLRRTTRQQKSVSPPKKRYTENISFDDEEVDVDTDPEAASAASDCETAQMDLTKISKMRSAKGGELLCVDGYIYHIKGSVNGRNYWICIKSKDTTLKCKSRVATISLPGDNNIRVIRVSNHHSHGVNQNDLKRRLYNTIVQTNRPTDIMKLGPGYVMEKSFTELNTRYGEILNDPMQSILEKFQDDNPSPPHSTTITTVTTTTTPKCRHTMKLYAVSDGPPSLAVRMTLKALQIPYELMNVDYMNLEHLSDEYAKLNPQKEIPVLDDDGFYLSESIAIMQYLCDKYAANTQYYPKEATQRAVVNQRLCFNMGFYYAAISAHSMAPIFFAYQRTEMSLKKVNNALDVFEAYLKRGATTYVAANNVTIADFALVSATLCLEAIGFNLSPWPLVNKWYDTFKTENPDLWAIAKGGMQEIRDFEANPPDLSHMNHPFHPTRKALRP